MHHHPSHTDSEPRLKKAEGQLAHVARMVKDGAYCMDIIQQVNALIGILQQANSQLLARHLATCGANLASEDPEVKEKFIKEIVRAWTMAQRKG
ncbi:metal-sensitive transcriptional regulator [Candidatus Uhrbacteria bacterium]|nr:metal-sensitive transcriptional regulator [Candidatus Uhrbacteria bacterium]